MWGVMKRIGVHVSVWFACVVATIAIFIAVGAGFRGSVGFFGRTFLGALLIGLTSRQDANVRAAVSGVLTCIALVAATLFGALESTLQPLPFLYASLVATTLAALVQLGASLAAFKGVRSGSWSFRLSAVIAFGLASFFALLCFVMTSGFLRGRPPGLVVTSQFSFEPHLSAWHLDRSVRQPLFAVERRRDGAQLAFIQASSGSATPNVEDARLRRLSARPTGFAGPTLSGFSAGRTTLDGMPVVYDGWTPAGFAGRVVHQWTFVSTTDEYWLVVSGPEAAAQELWNVGDAMLASLRMKQE